MCKFSYKKGVWPPIFFSWVLSNISRELKFWISGHLKVCILCNWSPTFENHENCKCANFCAKKGFGLNFFSWVLSNISREHKFWISGYLEVCILCNWSPTFENHENCKCANFCAKKGFGLQFFSLTHFRGETLSLQWLLPIPITTNFILMLNFLISRSSTSIWVMVQILPFKYLCGKSSW